MKLAKDSSGCQVSKADKELEEKLLLFEKRVSKLEKRANVLFRSLIGLLVLLALYSMFH